VPLRRHATCWKDCIATLTGGGMSILTRLNFCTIMTTRPDREVVGLIASSLAYGRVAQILKSVECVLRRMGPRPRSFPA